MRLAVFIATLALLATVMTFHEAPVAQPQVAPTDIGGVVSSVNGAEAGVWVIAETNDLPTKFAKIVVTDDRGRYLIPQLPKARYAIWARGYGLVDSHKVQATPGTALNLQALVAPSAAAAAEYYPAIYWYSMLRAPLPAEFPGTGPDGNGAWAHGQQARVEDVRGLDGSGRGGRAAGLEAHAPAGCRAQRRADHVGLGGAEGLSARRGLDGQARSARQSARPAVRGHGREHRPVPRPRSREPQGEPGEDARARSRDAIVEERADAAVALLGRGAHLGQPDEHAQSDARREEAGVVHVTRTAAGESRLLQEGIGSSLGEAVPGRVGEPASIDVRPEERKDHADQHVLPDASPRVRRRRQSHAVDERGRSGQRCDRMAESQDVRGNGRRGKVAGLDGADPRHERQRQARRLRRAEPARRSDEGYARGRRLLRRRRESERRHGVGIGTWLSGLRHSSEPGDEPTRDRADGSVRASAARLRTARHGHRPQRRDRKSTR